MTCTLIVRSDGSRMIACRRFDNRPRFQPEAVAIVPPASPWKVGARVKHARYGHGWITKRNAEAIDVCFDDPAFTSDRRFVLELVGKAMEVVS
jgi:hypothetical protein